MPGRALNWYKVHQIERKSKEFRQKQRNVGEFATEKQVVILRRHGINAWGMDRTAASNLIEEIQRTGVVPEKAKKLWGNMRRVPVPPPEPPEPVEWCDSADDVWWDDDELGESRD